MADSDSKPLLSDVEKGSPKKEINQEKNQEKNLEKNSEEMDLKLKNSVLRASVQTLTVIDGAITTLLLIAVLLIGVLVPYFEPIGGPHRNPPVELINGAYLPDAALPPKVLEKQMTPVPASMKFSSGITLYNSSDAYWWYYTGFEDYVKSLRKMGNVLDTTFVFILFVIVASDIGLAKGVDLLSNPKSTPRYVYYWLLCNTMVIIILPMLSSLSTRIANFTGVLRECGIGCGKPYFYITYRVLFGLMVVLFLCQLRKEMKLEPNEKKGKKKVTVLDELDTSPYNFDYDIGFNYREMEKYNLV